MWRRVQAVGGQEGELVRVLAHGGDAHLARAVEVHVSQLVRQPLNLKTFTHVRVSLPMCTYSQLLGVIV